MYRLKKEINLSLNGNATEKVEIKNNELIIHEADTIKYNTNGWFINNVYQGKGAWYEYQVENPEKKELFEDLFEEIDGAVEEIE